MNMLSVLRLLERWLRLGDREDALVAADGLYGMEPVIGWTLYEESQIRRLTEWRTRSARKDRAHALAPIVWKLVHGASRWRPDDTELRALLDLALAVRKDIRDPNVIVGGERGYINLTGLLWWAGRGWETDSSPRITTIARFVRGETDGAEFRQELLDDLEFNARLRRRRATERARRSRRRALRVYHHDTASPLLGVPTTELIRQSERAPGGVVPAYREGDRWYYVAPSEVDFHRRFRGREVERVYVQ